MLKPKPVETPSFEQTYWELYTVEPPPSTIEYLSETDILRPGRGFVDSFDFTMQTQVGCPGGCLFCYVPASRRLTPPEMKGDAGERWGFEVRRKRDSADQFLAHLEQGRLADKTIYWSGVTDPYATPADETRAIWEILCAAPPRLRPRRVIVQTRFRADRDVDWMAGYSHTTTPSDGGPAVVVSLSIGTDRDDLIRAWERATPLFGQRMKTVETLRLEGIMVVPTLSPFGLWDDLPRALERFKTWNIPYITCLFFKHGTHSANTPPLFLDYLSRAYPMLIDPRWQRVQTLLLRRAYGANRVLFGKDGFASLAAPQQVVAPVGSIIPL